MLMTDRIFARLLYRELLDGDEARIAALSRTVIQKPFHSIVAAVRKGRLQVPAREVALSLVGFALGHVLVLPLAPGPTGERETAEPVDRAVARLLDLTQPAQAKAGHGPDLPAADGD